MIADKSQNNKQWPLEGVKVLDLGQIYNGPYAGFLMAHAGADVIKVEPLTGEVLRQRGGGQVPLSFSMLNTNKRGIAIDLKKNEGKKLLLDLAGEADVLLENFAPGAMERLGLGIDLFLESNPGLIYASGSGYGLSGPKKNNLAMDLTVQAIGGIMSINGPETGPPMKAGAAICDFVGGVHLYAGIVTALYEREKTGLGGVVEVAMQEAIYPVLTSNIASLHKNKWKQPARRGNKHPTQGSAPYNVYETTDGYIAIICVKDAHWLSLLKVIAREDLLTDQRFKTQALRATNEDVVDEIVENWTKTKTKDQAAELLKTNKIPAAPVRNLEEVTQDEHMHERGMLNNINHPTMGDVILPKSPIRFHKTPESELNIEPTIGQHTREVLVEWLKISGEKVDTLIRAGVIGENDENKK
ncbi:MAG: CoA transferase [Pseudomonadota bacterium]|jgi:CoA:oxalate CoA-transferase|nr:CoA transferase [Pseudomonadota bacterium]